MNVNCCFYSLKYTGPKTDDTISTERNITKLKSELTKTKWNTKTMQELLRATFTACRKAMLKIDARSRITKTLREFRCLSHQVEVNTICLQCNDCKEIILSQVTTFVNTKKCCKPNSNTFQTCLYFV